MWGLYQYNFLPFGLSVSPNIFQTTINEVIKGTQGVRAYQDDLIVFGKSSDEHRRNLKQLLERLKQFNVKINASKSIFGVQKIKYLGYCIDGNGITPDQERIQPIIKAPKPTTMNQLKSFLGFMQYYSTFIPHFSTIAEPLFEMLSQKQFTWNPKENQAYENLLSQIISSKSLKSFNPSEKCHITVDASEFGLEGGVLEQSGQPVIFISRRLSSAERNYSKNT